MKVDPFSVAFHDLLGDLSALRSALFFLLTGKVGVVNQEMKKYLEESLKKCDSSIAKIGEIRKSIK